MVAPSLQLQSSYYDIHTIIIYTNLNFLLSRFINYRSRDSGLRMLSHKLAKDELLASKSTPQQRTAIFFVKTLRRTLTSDGSILNSTAAHPRIPDGTEPESELQ